jgi:hypothetical protein
MDADEVERRLDGWEEMVGEPGSFEWLVAHAAPHARPVAAKARALDLAG